MPNEEIQTSGTVAPDPTLNEANKVEGLVNVAAEVGAGLIPGGPIAEAGLGAAEQIANTIISSVDQHKSDVTTALAAVTAAANSAGPVIGKLPPETQAQVASGLSAAKGFFGWFESVLSEL